MTAVFFKPQQQQLLRCSLPEALQPSRNLP